MINTATNTVIATVRVGGTPTQVAVSPDGTLAYVTNSGSKSVSVINTATNTVIATVGVGRTPTQVMVSPDGSRVYVANTGSKSVSVIDTATNTVVETIGVGGGPVALAVTSGGSLPIVTPPSPPTPGDPTTGAETGSLGVVDPDGERLTITFAEGGAPRYGTVVFDNAAGTYTYIPNQAARIRAGLGEVIEDSFTVNVTQPASQTGGAQIYVVNSASNTVSVIGAEPAPVSQTLKAAAAPAALDEEGFSEQVTVDDIEISPAEFAVTDEFVVSQLTIRGSDRARSSHRSPRLRRQWPGQGTVSVINTTTNEKVVPDVQLRATRARSGSRSVPTAPASTSPTSPIAPWR